MEQFRDVWNREPDILPTRRAYPNWPIFVCGKGYDGKIGWKSRARSKSCAVIL